MSLSDHRACAREFLRGNWPTAILVTLVASLLGAVSYSGPTIQLNVDSLHSPGALFPGVPPMLAGILSFTGSLVVFAALLGIMISLIIGGAVHMGYCRYLLNLHDHREARFDDLWWFIDRFGTALCMQVLRFLAVMLGTMCLIVPGILLGYGLSMAGYILAENPECSAMEALRCSWDLMCGHKMQLFFLRLSFIGWDILASMTLGIGYLFLEPYRYAAYTSFYRSLSPAKHPDSAGCHTDPVYL